MHLSQKKRSVQENMIYNTIGTITYYFCQWIITIALGRISGYHDTGIFSLAMTVTTAPAIIGLFNIRNFQVSDLQGEYSDSVYLKSRFYTNAASLLVCIILIVCNGYHGNTVQVILAYMMLKIVDGFADVFYAIDQREERLDIAGISLTIRGICGLVLFFIVYMSTKNLTWSTMIMVFFSILFLLLFDYSFFQKKQKEVAQKTVTGKPEIEQVAVQEAAKGKKVKETENHNILSLLFTCFPLMAVNFLNNLSLSVPRIYLERFHGSTIMGIYALVSSPTVVIQLAASTLFAPLVPIMTSRYLAKDKKGFLKILRNFGLLMLAVTVVSIVGGKLLGRWALILICGRKIAPHVWLFVPVLLVSILIAINASFFSICTLMRAIHIQYIIGIAGIVSSMILSLTMVKKYAMSGVVWTMTLALLIQIAIQIVIIWQGIRKCHDEPFDS
jgi:O-antigen/teichoic acid export membrane protein